MLKKKLISNATNIRKLLKVLIFANTINCYNKVTHLFMSLSTQYFSLEITYFSIFYYNANDDNISKEFH